MAKQKSTVSVEAPLRRRGTKRRMVANATEGAAAMIGTVVDGDEISGLTNGQFSLIDIIEHLLSMTGPADVSISTWTMGIYDLERSRFFCSDRRIKRMRWLVDPSMFGRNPEISGILVEAFRPESFRAVNTHAKFCIIRGDQLDMVVRSSMNLNPNRRLEHFDISASTEMANWFQRFVDNAFDDVAEDARTQTESTFAKILREFNGAGANISRLAF